METHQKQPAASGQNRGAERLTRALDQLGTTDPNGQHPIEIRLGGIHALERLAGESEKDYWPVMETLTAHVREHYSLLSEKNESDRNKSVNEDLQSILKVIGRKSPYLSKKTGYWLNLVKTDLRNADLSEAHLEGAHLFDAHLEDARCMCAHLEGAYLHYAHLEGACFEYAHLEGAGFWCAHLEGAHLGNAHLETADLAYAHLARANLRGAHLEGADLTNATGLTREQIDVAFIDAATILPDYLMQEEDRD